MTPERYAQRRQRVEDATKRFAAGGLSDIMGRAHAAWCDGKDAIEITVEEALVMAVMAAERQMDKDIFGR